MAVLAINNPVVGEVRSAGGEASAGVEYGELSVDTQLSAAQVNALAATNIEIVAAPGAALAIAVTGIHLFLDHGGTNFAQDAADDALAILYNGGAEITELGTEAQGTAFIEASADSSLFITPPLGQALKANSAIDLDMNGGTEHTNGDGTLSVRVFYRVVPFVAFS